MIWILGHIEMATKMLKVAKDNFALTCNPPSLYSHDILIN
jgi:hypothetical protein